MGTNPVTGSVRRDDELIGDRWHHAVRRQLFGNRGRPRRQVADTIDPTLRVIGPVPVELDAAAAHLVPFARVSSCQYGIVRRLPKVESRPAALPSSAAWW